MLVITVGKLENTKLDQHTMALSLLICKSEVRQELLKKGPI